MKRFFPLALCLLFLLSACMQGPITPVSIELTQTAQPTATPSPAPSPTPFITPVPTPTPVPTYIRSVSPHLSVLPALLLQNSQMFFDGKALESYQRPTPLDFGAGHQYPQIDGVLTFRGNNYRDSGAYGIADFSEKKLEIIWELKIGGTYNTFSGDWTGVGWNGQPAIVRWPDETKRIMNLYPEKQAKQGLTEVIYGTMDGNIYFLDLEDGSATRDPIYLGYPIKGSVSVDPRGYPLLFVGQGISDKDGKRASKSGWRIYSLIDQSELFFLNGSDDLSPRAHRLFDSVCIVDAQRDTLIQCGENGLVYSIELNTSFDPSAGSLSIDPKVTTYRYKADISEYGIENSPSAYRNYIWFADNSGLLTCLDTTAMQPLWVFDTGDDTDASTVLEEDGENLFLYTACEVDKQGSGGNAYLRKLNALTGEPIWEIAVPCKRSTQDGGVLATPTLGKGNMEGLVFFCVCRAEKRDSFLVAVDTKTGEERWSLELSRSSWSSPTCVYNEDGVGVILHADGDGILRMIDGTNGEVLSTADLKSNVEGSPAIFNDTLVVGTRGQRIYACKIS